MLAGVDHFVDLALDVAELILLLIEFIRLSQLLDIARKTLNMVSICRILHLKIVVVLDQSLDLLLQSLLIHRVKLVLQATIVEVHLLQILTTAFVSARRAMLARAQR